MADNPFVICQYFNFGMWNFFLSMFHLGDSSVVASSAALKESIDTLWKAQLSVFVMLVLESFHNRLQALGEIVEKYLNIIDVNGGLSNIIYMILTGTGNAIISAPKPGSSNYLSAIGQLDWRTQLDRTIAIQHGGREIGGINHKFFPDNSVPEPVLMAELCIMSSKLAYENPETVKGIVTGTWNMNFVAQYNCWIEPQRVDATKVFLATDRQEEARVIVVAFRGTDPFNTFNWITDFDFSWYNLKNLGRVHVGFLEALGLGSRDNLETFAELQRRLLDPASPGSSMSGLPGNVTSTKLLAYDVVTQKLKELIQTHKDAKIYVTGHSLGGALACLYSALLYYAEEFELADRIGGVFTFGQPRVGDYEFVSFYNGKLTQPNRYFRVVYNNDVVPRVPFDNSISGFEHAGICRYFDSFYNGMLLAEVPNKNYFSIFYYLPMTISAIWELLYNTLILPFLHGHDYLETKISTLFRTVGVLFPGIGSHSPVSYVNSVRLGTSSENLW
ncbi:hypothetical protein O6H91_16G073000 [Diphasiastrum complanatum]|uniref:Uncharacterized protein n=1 Tax=Diphasiastrum complanatum TaxID=34168 RepID=A0ACC2BDI7_DIPCM|nr:hypothetical protein O6H91_16G073000 [Diphasiastrum complanatum]